MRKYLNPIYKGLQPIYAPLVNRYIRYRQIIKRQEVCRQQVKERLEKGIPIQVMIGAAHIERPEWISTDLPYLDMTKRSHWRAIFQPHSITYMVGEHVVEHLTVAQFRKFLRTIPEFLADNHNIRIAIPDGYHTDPAYIENVRPNGRGPGSDDHKILYNADLIREILLAEGYEYKFLEYFDEQGIFHRTAWDETKGHIARSQDNDSRNSSDNPTAYTSLIVDFNKA